MLGKLPNISWYLKYFICKSLGSKQYLTCQESLLKSLQNLTSVTKICSSLESSREKCLLRWRWVGILSSVQLPSSLPSPWSWRFSFTTRPIVLFNQEGMCSWFLELAPIHFSNCVKPCIFSVTTFLSLASQNEQTLFSWL